LFSYVQFKKIYPSKGENGSPSPRGLPGQQSAAIKHGMIALRGLLSPPGPYGERGAHGDRGLPIPDGPPVPKGQTGDRGHSGPNGQKSKQGDPERPGPSGLQVFLVLIVPILGNKIHKLVDKICFLHDCYIIDNELTGGFLFICNLIFDWREGGIKNRIYVSYYG